MFDTICWILGNTPYMALNKNTLQELDCVALTCLQYDHVVSTKLSSINVSLYINNIRSDFTIESCKPITMMKFIDAVNLQFLDIFEDNESIFTVNFVRFEKNSNSIILVI